MFVLVKYHNYMFKSRLRPTPAPLEEVDNGNSAVQPIWGARGGGQLQVRIENRVSQIRTSMAAPTQESRQSMVTPDQLQQMAKGRVSQAQARVSTRALSWS